MELKRYNTAIAREVLIGTKWENLFRFWENNIYKFDQYIVFGPNPDAKKLLTLDKKIPEMLLFGAIIENRFLNKAQIQDMAKMPSIEQLHGELSGILQMPAQKTVSLLSRNQQALSMNLEQYVKDCQNKESS